MSALKYNTKKHRFGPNETIRGVIRKLNHQGMAPKMLDLLLQEFNTINREQVPHPGEEFDIPIFVGFIGMGDDSNKSGV